jgi:hypothetical protein
LWLAVATGAGAHEFKLDAVMTSFVKVDADHAELVIRAPLYLFKPAKLPIRNAEIDVPNAGPALERAIEGIERDVVLFEDGQPLPASGGEARLSLPSDRSFETYESAVKHVGEPIAPDTHIYVDQGYVDARITYPIRSPKSVFAVRTTAAPELGTYLKMTVRYLPLGEEGRALLVTSSSGAVDLNPTWYGAAAAFVGLGVEHILTGTDHLLFLLCLIIPLFGWRQVLAIVSTFTVAHSFTLLGSAFGLVPGGEWFPPFVETVIAASIVYVALENIVAIDVARRILVTGLFGLVHGFGFAYGLQENLQFAGTHLLASLVAFNVGIELGQLGVLLVMLPAVVLIRRHVLTGRVGMIILSALAAHVAWHWMTDRWDALAKVSWPQPSLSGALTLALWAGGILLAAGGVMAIVHRLRLAPSPAATASAAD